MTAHGGHEAESANVPALALITLALYATIAVCGLIVHWLLPAFISHPAFEPRVPVVASEDSLGVEHWIHPGAVIREAREEERSNLSRYGWRDRSRGIATIPIDQAMAIVARESWPLGPKPLTPRGGPSR